MTQATAVAHPNIALIKYWGKRDVSLNLPAVSSLSLTLSNFCTKTTVHWGANSDQMYLNGAPAPKEVAHKSFQFLNLMDSDRPPCRIDSQNNFPTAAGLASSASGFAALALSASRASGSQHTASELSALARQGSGSACRSLWGGWVLWQRGIHPCGKDSHGIPLFGQDYWNLNLVVAVASSAKKAMGSTKGMIHTKQTSPYYASWVETSEADVSKAKQALQDKDFTTLGEVMEHSTMKMHACMMGARPSLRYLQPASFSVLSEIEALRTEGIETYATMDAGPNVKILCRPENSTLIADRVRPYVEQVHVLSPGPDAHVID